MAPHEQTAAVRPGQLAREKRVCRCLSSVTLAAVLFGCSSPQPYPSNPVPTSVVREPIPQQEAPPVAVKPAPLGPSSAPLPTFTKPSLILHATETPQWTTNIVGTNVIVGGVNKYGKYVYYTNPPTGPLMAGTRTYTWNVPGWLSLFPVPVYSQMLSSPSPLGPWTNCFAVLVTNTNMAVNITVDTQAPSLFFKLGAVGPWGLKLINP
jgi:hypothetical protein